MKSGAHGQHDDETLEMQDEPYTASQGSPCPPEELRAYLAAVADANGLTVAYAEQGGGGGGYEMPILTPKTGG